MMVLITYDVETVTSAGRRRLRKVARQCLNYGQRVQNSVFECVVDPAQYAILRHRLEEIIDPEKDSLRFYHLGSKWNNKVVHIGIKPSFDPEDDTFII
ncbi:MAG: CRISPR-associated endonuclease Cas2 [Bacteroidales bacterium]